MRTTIRMNEALARQVKAFAERNGKTFTQTVEQAVTELLSREGAPPRPKRLKLQADGDPRNTITPAQLKRAVDEADLEYDLSKLGLAARRRQR